MPRKPHPPEGVSDVQRTEGEPHNRLTRLCDEITRDLPESVKAIVMLDEGTDAGFVAIGYDADDEIEQTFYRHWQAWQIGRMLAAGEGPADG